MKPINAKRERGAALLALLAAIMLGAAWFLVSQLNAESGGRPAVNRNRNAEVLNRAKLALIGHIAAQTAEAGERNPGRLPCPEHAWYIGISDKEGVAGPSVGVPNPGSGSSDCASAGRLPWRTLGTDKLVDATSEPLWYVVSPGWALSNSTTPPLTTYINSNSTGQLLVNARSVSTLSQSAGTATVVSAAHGFRTGDVVKIAGAVPAGYNVAASVTVTNANTFTYTVDSTLSTPASGTIKAGDPTVALIIAPGQAMSVAASTGCAARNQIRSVPSSTINALDYLECYDAANGVFSTTGSSGSFNDQVLIITAADVMPAIEAAIANRIEREIVPALKSVYAPPNWGISGSNPMYPFPAPFSNPGPGLSTSNYQGASTNPTCPTGGTWCEGLLPFNYTNSCTPATDPRCNTNFVQWNTSSAVTVSKVSGTSNLDGPADCSGSSATQLSCRIKSRLDCSSTCIATIEVSINAQAINIAMALRAFDTSVVSNMTPTGMTASLTTAGAANASVRGSLPTITCAGCSARNDLIVTVPISAFKDHSLLDPNDATIGWFVRNEWYRLLYYAVARGHTAAMSPPVCPTTTPFVSSCLSVANVTPAGAQRAILILAGRSINGTARPSSTLANYLEFGNATAAFERQPVSLSVAAALKKPFNDRIVVVGSN